MNPLSSTLASLCRAYRDLGYHTEIYPPKFINPEEYSYKAPVPPMRKEPVQDISQQHLPKVRRHIFEEPVVQITPQDFAAGKKKIDKFLQKVILFSLDEDLEKVKLLLKDLKKHSSQKQKYKLIEKRVKLVEKKINKKFKGL